MLAWWSLPCDSMKTFLCQLSNTELRFPGLAMECKLETPTLQPRCHFQECQDTDQLIQSLSKMSLYPVFVLVTTL